MNITENAFDKTFDKVVRALPIPSLAEEGIIAVKNILKDDKVQEKISNILTNIFDKNKGNIKNIDDIKNILKSSEYLGEILKIIDIKKLNSSKEIIVSNVVDEEINNIYKGQEKLLSDIDKQYTKWEKYFNKMDIEKMDKTYESIKKKFDKLLPTVEIIDRIKEIDNLTLLAKSKIDKGENNITQMEKELCRKAG